MKIKDVIAFISGFICGVLASRLRKKYLRVHRSNEEETIRKYTRDIIFKSYKEAEEVLSDMKKIADHYGEVTPAHFFDISNVLDYIDTEYYRINHYIWKKDDLEAAEIERTDDGLYYIKFPQAKRRNDF